MVSPEITSYTSYREITTVKQLIIGEDLFGEIGELIHFAKIIIGTKWKNIESTQ